VDVVAPSLLATGFSVWTRLSKLGCVGVQLAAVMSAGVACSDSGGSASSGDAQDDGRGESTSENDDADDQPNGSDDTENEEPEGEAPTGSGKFGAIWRQVSAELMVIDADTPIPELVSVEIPEAVPFPETESEVELYEQITDGRHVTYAYVVGAEVYYRITTPATEGDDAYSLQRGDAVSLYTMEDGRLTASSTLSTGNGIVQVIATFEEYTGTFPPEEWPSEMVEGEIGGPLQ
jgi:hypothetical protein